MKTLLSVMLAVVLVAACLYLFVDPTAADSPGMSPKGCPVMSLTCTIAGEATAVSTIGPLNGYIDGIYVTMAGTASATVTVTIATSASYGPFGVARTLYSNTTLDSTDNGYMPIRQQAKDTSGSGISGVYVPFFCMGDYVTMSATNCTTTGATIRATIVLCP